MTGTGIDTVRWHLAKELSPEALERLGHTRIPPEGPDDKGWHGYFQKLCSPAGGKARLAYYPQNERGKPVPMFTAECSLGSLLCADLFDECDAADEMLKTATGDLDAARMAVNRAIRKLATVLEDDDGESGQEP